MNGLWKKNPSSVVATAIVIILCIVLVIKNCKNPCFFAANLTEIITILVGVIIAIFITERLTDQRRRNDCIEHIIIEIEDFIMDDSNFVIDKSTFIKHGSCGNRIKYLKDAGFADIKSDIDFIESNFQNIRDLYSNHNQSEEALLDVKVDIDKHRMNIVDKCCKIRLLLYRG